jgi:hypothetical protein
MSRPAGFGATIRKYGLISNQQTLDENRQRSEGYRLDEFNQIACCDDAYALVKVDSESF